MKRIILLLFFFIGVYLVKGQDTIVNFKQKGIANDTATFLLKANELITLLDKRDSISIEESIEIIRIYNTVSLITNCSNLVQVVRPLINKFKNSYILI